MDCLCQPLSIDTSISYDLDITMFPGLDNVLELQEPALVMWTPEVHHQWLEACTVDEDDLYDLIESCPLDILTGTCQSEEDVFQSSLDDIIDSTSTGVSYSDADSLQSDVDIAHSDATPNVPPTMTTPPSTARDTGDDSGYDGTQTLKRKHDEGTSALSKRLKGDENVVATRFLHGLHDICYRNS